MNESPIAQFQATEVEPRLANLAYVLNTTGLYTALRHDERFQSARAAGIGAANSLLSNYLNGKVHDSLNIIEKIGFDPFGRVARRKKYAAAAVGVANFTLQVGTDLLLYRLEQHAKRQSVQELASWIGYVHGAEPTPRMLAHLARQEHELGLGNNTQAVAHFESAIGQRLSALSRPANPKARYSMLLDVAAVVDTKEPATSGRLEQLAAYAGIADADVESAVADFDETNEVESDVAGVTAGILPLSFQDFFAHAEGAMAAAHATLDNDPFAATRAKRREIVKNVGVPAALATLTFFTGGVGDFLLVAAAPIVHAAIGKPDNVETMLRVSKALRSGLGTAKSQK